MKWIRSRVARPVEEPVGQHCTGCRTTIPGATEDEFLAAGGVFLATVGWFCGGKCERQYRLRFRITPANGSQAASQPHTPTPRPAPLAADPEPQAPARRSAADELADALKARRRAS